MFLLMFVKNGELDLVCEFASNERWFIDTAASAVASLKEQQHVDLEALPVFATNGNTVAFRGVWELWRV